MYIELSEFESISFPKIFGCKHDPFPKGISDRGSRIADLGSSILYYDNTEFDHNAAGMHLMITLKNNKMAAASLERGLHRLPKPREALCVVRNLLKALCNIVTAIFLSSVQIFRCK